MNVEMFRAHLKELLRLFREDFLSEEETIDGIVDDAKDLLEDE